MAYEVKFDSAEAANLFLTGISSCRFIAGLDEVGRGSLCGPVVAACVVLPSEPIVGIADSKRLSARRREKLAEEIMQKARYGIGVCENEEIDKINIFRAAHKASLQAYRNCLAAIPDIDYLICDGGLDLREFIKVPSTSVIKGDYWIKCIGAASIIAKVYRDTQMTFYHDMYPEYGFNTNSGYGTKIHLKAIEKYGVSPLHRRTFGICRTAKVRV